MKGFSIKQLENFSGVKAHTIRMWEQRYRVFKPDRNHGNIRRYSLEDVELLLDLALLIKNGTRISKLVKIDTETIGEKTNALTDDENSKSKAVNQLIIFMFSADIEQFEEVLDGCVDSFQVDTTIKDVIIPFLEKVQLLSYNDSSNEVHFAVTAIRRKIMLGLERASPTVQVPKTALLFLAEAEHYDLLLLYMAYILKSNGLRVLYMGTNISEKNLELVATMKRPDLLYIYIPQKQNFKMHGFAKYLQDHLPEATLFVVGCEDTTIQNEHISNVRFIHYNAIGNTLPIH